MAERPVRSAPPADLRAALERREATIDSWRVERARVYVWATAPAGGVFARFSSDPRDVGVFAHEAAVRAVVGVEGVLRSPRVLESGRGWLLEEAIRPSPLVGEICVDTAAAAAARLAGMELPKAVPRRRPAAMQTLRRRVRTAVEAVPARDMLAARRVMARTRLPLVTSHGDFHTKNVLRADGAAWVIDWELSGARPAGFDLMQLWATLERDEDRERLFGAAVALVGVQYSHELARLRYVLAVRTIAAALASARPSDRDPALGTRLLRLLPRLRAEARDEAA